MPRWQYQVKTEPVVTPDISWYQQVSEPVRLTTWRPESVTVEPAEWLFWGWLEQLPAPEHRIIYHYLVQQIAEVSLRQLFMQARNYLGF